MSSMIPERKFQYRMLSAALTGDVPPVIFLHGLPSSGKSYIMEQVLKPIQNAKTARISAAEALCGKRAFFETILKQLGIDKVEKNGKFVDVRCDNTQAFLRVLIEVYKHKVGSERAQRLIVFVENVETLNCAQYGDLFTVLLLTHNISLLNICFVLSSTLPWSSYTTATGGLCKNVPIIYFPQYSKEEIISIICRSPPPQAEANTYKFYVSTLVNVFYRNCRELRKLWRLASVNYSEFILPLSGKIDDADDLYSTPKSTNAELHKLWKNIEPKLKSDFVTLNSQFLPIQNEKSSTYYRDEPTASTSSYSFKLQPTNSKSSNSKLIYDLPEYTKYILIAAYIASNNPPSTDKRFFVKAKSKSNTSVAKQSKRFKSGGGDASDKKTNRVAQLFSFARLQAIFSAICASNFLVTGKSKDYQPTRMNTAHMSQIVTLCDARLLAVGAGEDSLENRKYKCLADFEFVNAISKSVDFDLSKYLYEMLS